MKKYVFQLVIYCHHVGSSVDCRSDDESSQTAALEISFEILKNVVAVTAKGLGEVLLYLYGASTSNLTILQRSYQDYEAIFTTSAQEANQKN